MQVRLDDRARYAWAQIERSAEYLADGRGQIRSRLPFQHVSPNPDVKRLQDVLRLVVNGEQDDFCSRRHLSNLPGGIETVQQRHRHVENGHVGLKPLREADSLVTIGRLADDIHAAALQQRSAPLANEEMVIGQNQPGRHGFAPEGMR